MTGFDLVHKRRYWFIISLLMLIPGFISMGFNGFNLGIDFTGGSLFDLKFKQQVTVDQIRNVLYESNIKNPVIQLSKKEGSIQSTTARAVIIRTKPLEIKEEKILLENLKNKIGNFDLLRVEKIGGVIGSELTKKAWMGVAISAAIMVLYITFRFEFLFAISGIVALFHDIFLVMGIFSIFKLEVDSTFIAAILTILGYSINDTVVIFDRIRENLGKMKKNETISSMVNTSLWQTMRRSVYTVATVMFCTIALYFFGSKSTKNFSLALLIGFFSGAYSSVFNASQIWVALKTKSLVK